MSDTRDESGTALDPDPLPAITLLGAGSLGGAILAGLTSPGVRRSTPIAVTTRTARSATALARAGAACVVSREDDPAANARAVRGARLVILAVKPRLVRPVLREIAGDLAPGSSVVSVAAGVTLASMEACLPAGAAALRAMPNTPALVGRAVTGIARGVAASDDDAALVRRVFETVGTVLEVPEERINAVTAVSGSGPAYLFWYVEQLAAAAQRLGFSETEAALLARETVIGSAELLRHSEEGPERLRERVTSPGGTTERAVEVLDAGGWGTLLDRALLANIRRSEEIEREGESRPT